MMKDGMSEPKCPQCGGLDSIVITYGYPLPGWEQKVESGEMVLGGCVVDGNEPDWECKTCKTQFVWPPKEGA